MEVWVLKKQKKPKLLILYNDGSMLEVSEKKLTVNLIKKAQYLLVPALKKPNVYWCVRAAKEWFASRYIIDIAIDAVYVDFEDGDATNYGTVPSHFETTSLVEAVNFVCTLYKLNGYGEVIEQGTNDLNSCVHIFTPSKIHMILLDSERQILREYESEEYHCPDGESNDAVEIIFNLERQADCLDDLIIGFGADSSSLNGIPQLIETDFQSMQWRARKKITKCKYGGFKLFRIDYFGAYFLGSDDIWNRCLCTKGIWCRIFGLSTLDVQYLNTNLQTQIFYVDHPAPITKNVFCEACENDDIDTYKILYHMPINDAFTFIQWIAFSEDIISYMTLMTYMIDSCSNDTDISDIKILIFACDNDQTFDSPDSLMCSQSEALLGKFRQYLLSKVYKEEK